MATVTVTATAIGVSGEAEVTVITVGPEAVKETLKKDCLAVGCDKAVIITDPAWSDRDCLSTAKVLSAKLKELGAEVAFFGKVATDQAEAGAEQEPVDHVGQHARPLHQADESRDAEVGTQGGKAGADAEVEPACWFRVADQVGDGDVGFFGAARRRESLRLASRLPVSSVWPSMRMSVSASVKTQISPSSLRRANAAFGTTEPGE